LPRLKRLGRLQARHLGLEFEPQLGAFFLGQPPRHPRSRTVLRRICSALSRPWAPGRVSLYRTIFPQMASYLPDDEGTQLRFEFETELARLEAA
jgi:hypothetical protein